MRRGGPDHEQKRAAAAFRGIVWPALVERAFLPAGELVWLEGSPVDHGLGLDWAIGLPSGSQVTLAARVQYDVDWGTYTIRYQTRNGRSMTEYAKRYHSVKDGGTFPTYTVQAYVVEPDVLLNAYVVDTRRMFDHIGFPPVLCACVGRQNQAWDGAKFYPVAITEQGRNVCHARATLLGHDIPVDMVRPRDVALGLGLL